MSEAGENTAADGVTAGRLLREARESAGLHIANLAANLKVPVRKLEALEEDRYELLGDAVFVRALASSVCRTLKVDPQPVLQRLPQTAQPRLAQDSEGINAPFRSPKDGPTPGWLDQVSRPVMFTVVALLLGALVLVFLPSVQRGYDTVAQAVNDKSEPVMPPPGAAATVPTAPAPVEGPSMTAAVNPIPAAPSPAANPAAIGAAAPEAVVAAAAVAPAAPATPAPAASSPAGPAAVPASGAQAASGVVVFRTRGPSWVEVTDARGTTVLRRLMTAGESAGASGTTPLSVTVGDVGQTEVQVRGKPYNLGPVSRDNVARFQVN
jgi:cytoskeleton protein RodZ